MFGANPLLLLGLVAEAANVDAEKVRERLSWVAPTECPSERELEAAVVALRDPEVPLDRDVRGRVTVEDGRWRVLFEVFAEERRLGIRRLEIEGECRDGLETWAFVATLLLEGGPVERPTEADEPEAGEAPVPAVAPEAPAEPDKLAPLESPYGASVFAGVGFRPGLFPVLGSSLEVGGAFVFRGRYSLGAVGSLFASESASREEDGRLVTSGGGARLEACAEAGEVWRFGACGGAALFAIEGRGVGFVETRRPWVVVPSVFAALRLAMLFEELGLFVRGDVGVGGSLERYSFVTSDGSSLFSQSEIFPWFVLGAGRLW